MNKTIRFVIFLTALIGAVQSLPQTTQSAACPKKTRISRKSPKATVVYDERRFDYETLRRIATEAGTAPMPLKDAKTPGKSKEGRPWDGTFVWQSHKTNLVIETYVEGQRHGPSAGYHSPQVKHWDGKYVRGKKDGVFRIWDAVGKLVETEVYDHGTKVPADDQLRQALDRVLRQIKKHGEKLTAGETEVAPKGLDSARADVAKVAKVPITAARQHEDWFIFGTADSDTLVLRFHAGFAIRRGDTKIFRFGFW